VQGLGPLAFPAGVAALRYLTQYDSKEENK